MPRACAGRLARGARREGHDEDFVVARAAGTSFLVVGDPGEGDDPSTPSSRACSQAEGIDFAVICKDLIYPTATSATTPSASTSRTASCMPIFGVPGNHDGTTAARLHAPHLRIDDRTPLDFGVGACRWIAEKTAPLCGRPTTCWRRCVERSAEAQMPPPRRRTSRSTPGRCGSSRSTPASRATSTPSRPFGLASPTPSGAEAAARASRSTSTASTPGTIAGEPGQSTTSRDARANYVGAIGGDIHNTSAIWSLPDGRTLWYVARRAGAHARAVERRVARRRRGRLPLLAARRLAGALLAAVRHAAREVDEPDPGRGVLMASDRARYDPARPAGPPSPRAAAGIQPPLHEGLPALVSEAFD